MSSSSHQGGGRGGRGCRSYKDSPGNANCMSIYCEIYASSQIQPYNDDFAITL